MAINLQKGQAIDLRKGSQGENFDLSQVTIGLGWDVRKKNGGFLKSLFGGDKEEEYDLDAIAFLLDSNNKIADLGKTIQKNGGASNYFEGDIIFYNSMKHKSGNIWLTGDNRTGDGDGDDEQIIVKLDALDQKYQKILFIVTIYQGKKKNQNFAMIDNAFIRAVDKNGKEIVKYTMSGDSTYNGMCSMVFSEVYRSDGGWKFKAVGELNSTDSFGDILKKYS
jgi:tellurium resistance protein TerD